MSSGKIHWVFKKNQGWVGPGQNSVEINNSRVIPNSLKPKTVINNDVRGIFDVKGLERQSLVQEFKDRLALRDKLDAIETSRQISTNQDRLRARIAAKNNNFLKIMAERKKKKNNSTGTTNLGGGRRRRTHKKRKTSSKNKKTRKH